MENPAVTALRAAVSANPASYEAHLALVQALQQEPESSEALREAREAFAAAFPLSPELWAEWIADESTAAAEDSAGQLHVKSLYERAFQDYQCASLWPGYLALLEALCDAEVSVNACML